MMDYIWNEIKNVYMEYNLDDLAIKIFGGKFIHSDLYLDRLLVCNLTWQKVYNL